MFKSVSAFKSFALSHLLLWHAYILHLLFILIHYDLCYTVLIFDSQVCVKYNQLII